MERERLVEAMKSAGGKKSAAAKILGMSRSTLWRKLRAHRISASPSPTTASPTTDTPDPDENTSADP